MFLLFLLCHVFWLEKNEGTPLPETDQQAGLNLAHLSETLLLLASGPWDMGGHILLGPV